MAEISADYFGHFFRAIQHLLGPQTVGLLFNGASGNINNVNAFKSWPHRGHAQAARMAQSVLAGHVLTEIQLMQMHDHVALGAAIDEFDFARKQTTDEDVSDRGEGAEGRVCLYRGAVLSGNRPAHLSALGTSLCSRSQGTARAAADSYIEDSGAACGSRRVCRAAG